MISVLAECHWSGTWMLCLPCEQFHCSTCSWKASEKFRSCTFHMLRSKNGCQEPSRLKYGALKDCLMRCSCLQTWLGNLGVCQASFSPRMLLARAPPFKEAIIVSCRAGANQLLSNWRATAYYKFPWHKCNLPAPSPESWRSIGANFPSTVARRGRWILFLHCPVMRGANSAKHENKQRHA